jgi:hypothetical protein
MPGIEAIASRCPLPSSTNIGNIRSLALRLCSRTNRREKSLARKRRMRVWGNGPRCVVNAIVNPRSKRGERACSRRKCLRDVVVVVCARHKARFIGRRREVDTLVQHAVEKAVEPCRVAGHHLVVTRHAGGVSKEAAEHRAGMVGGEWNACRICRHAQALAQLFGAREHGLVETGLRDDVERGQARRHRDRVARQCARLVHRAQRRDLLHDGALAAEGAHRHAAADHLAQRGQVGLDAVIALRARQAEPKPGHHLVEYQNRAAVVCTRRAAFRGNRGRAGCSSYCRPRVPRWRRRYAGRVP